MLTSDDAQWADVDVVRAAMDGDGAAFRAIYEDLAPSILGYLSAKGVSDPEAVTGDVFLALLPRLPELIGGAAGLRTLAFSIAHAWVVDEYRARARRPVSTSYEAADDPRRVESAETSAQRSLDTERVVRLLNLLDGDQREALTLRIIGDLSIEQVAEILGKSQGAVKQLLRRGLITLRSALAGQDATR